MEERFLKLTNTAYKVLEFFPEADPLKNKAKEKVLAIMENLPQKEKVSGQLLLDLDLLLSYLKIAREQRWIDDINFLILAKEYEAIKKEIPLPSLIKSRASLLQEVAGEEKDLTGRQKKIMEMLNEKEKAQVSDIIKVLPNITKRTIRRDLDGLLQMGKVVRVGEWNQVFYQTFKKENIDRTIHLS